MREMILTDKSLTFDERRRKLNEILKLDDRYLDEVICSDLMNSSLSDEDLLHNLIGFFPKSNQQDWIQHVNVRKFVSHQQPAKKLSETINTSQNAIINTYIHEIRKIYESVGRKLKLYPGAPEQEILALMSFYSHPIDKTLIDLLKVTDGTDEESPIFCILTRENAPAFCSLLSVSGPHGLISQCYKAGTFLKEDEQPNATGLLSYGWPEQVKEVFSSEHRLVFAQYNVQDELIMLDYEPTSTGDQGQVIAYHLEDTFITYVAKDFETFLLQSVELMRIHKDELKLDW